MDAVALETLDLEAYISLATFRRSGRAVQTPVWFALRDGRLWVFSAGDAGKVKRLRNGSHIRVAPCTVRGRVTGDWLEGTGRIVDDSAEIEAAYDALRDKYGWQMRLTDFLSGLSGRRTRRAVLALTLS
ncbi:MAG: PPOX class F420-dependent oxidoreductase [Deltaproteobacteria bacterium]|nr:PPOX class F420-dependent oxidoreductase [Deltaproteobacteria bacterium]MBW2371989.1 PPOX class F420-dependent oxidoreductase [Deltaproteobacteria bacterium]